MSASLYLIPSSLGETSITKIFPNDNFKIIQSLDYFIVENFRSARRFLRSVGFDKDFEKLIMFELNKHTGSMEIEAMTKPLLNNHSTGIISEAGVPAVADPGSEIVLLAHRKNIRVIPLIGPSSILIALMSSGFNGQKFTFHGYLPVKSHERIRAIKALEKRSYQNRETQIFMETPYRNMKMIEDIFAHASQETLFCIACDLSLETEFIKTKSIREWKKMIPEIHKRPAIFLLQGYS
ncbi:MAG: SAM-dependent methyltransferase [Bacteroidota bacterium]|nr:SAM-dependent methyltransferase [Bacteroidota bacterium]